METVTTLVSVQVSSQRLLQESKEKTYEHKVTVPEYKNMLDMINVQVLNY